MPIEVELKARLTDPDTTIARLRERAPGEQSTYHDAYYDWPDRRLERAGRQELRLRQVETSADVRCLWTFKAAMLDDASTPEYETTVADADAAHSILTGLGLQPVIKYTKQCENFRFDHAGRAILATVVTIPEIAGVFLEVETVVTDKADADEARLAVESVLAGLAVSSHDLDPTYYIDLVRETRG